MPNSGSGVVCFIDLDHLIAITVGDILADPIEHECLCVYFPTRTFYAISVKPYSSLFASCMQLKLLSSAIVPCVSILLVIWVFFPTGNSAYQIGNCDDLEFHLVVKNKCIHPPTHHRVERELALHR